MFTRSSRDLFPGSCISYDQEQLDSGNECRDDKRVKPMPFTYARLKKLALALKLPGVTEATSWGQPCLKAHGKLWVWWSPHEDAPVFKISRDMRDMLIELDGERYFVTPHYAPHDLILVRPGRLDADWARKTLLDSWRAMAPKRLLKAFDGKRMEGKR